MTPATTPQPIPAGAAAPPPQGRTVQLDAAKIADIAAGQALSVPGVIRLQPGLRHAVGRAARTMFIHGGSDDRSAAAGIDVAIDPDPRLTVRIVTTADPTPRVTAGAVQDEVIKTLLEQTGKTFTVLVVVVDVDPDG